MALTECRFLHFSMSTMTSKLDNDCRKILTNSDIVNSLSVMLPSARDGEDDDNAELQDVSSAQL